MWERLTCTNFDLSFLCCHSDSCGCPQDGFAVPEEDEDDEDDEEAEDGELVESDRDLGSLEETLSDQY